jgi:putative transcriptional regulator
MRLNQVQFAQLLGIHPITVSKWERGESNPTAYQATLLEHFRTAAKDQKVRDSVGGVLVGMGVGVALALLLKHLLKK